MESNVIWPAAFSPKAAKVTLTLKTTPPKQPEEFHEMAGIFDLWNEAQDEKLELILLSFGQHVQNNGIDDLGVECVMDIIKELFNGY